MDREKVIKGLEHCRKTSCESCPYNATDVKNSNPICLINEMISDALALLKEQEETIGELYDLLEDTCKDFREATGGDDVCGLCHYEGCAYKGEEDWCGWCPGFDSDECFVMKNEIRKMAGKELLPDIDPQ